MSQKKAETEQSFNLPPVEGSAESPTEKESMGGDGDAFNLDSLRLSQNFTDLVRTKKHVTGIPIGRFAKHSFCRIHPDEKYRLVVGVLEYDVDRTTYIATGDIALRYPDVFVAKMLFLGVDQDGNLFICIVKMPDENDRIDEWNRSAMELAKLAMTTWVRVTSNQSSGRYEGIEPQCEMPDPEWPATSFEEILGIAFRDHLIDSPDHPILRRLRGEV